MKPMAAFAVGLWTGTLVVAAVGAWQWRSWQTSRDQSNARVGVELQSHKNELRQLRQENARLLVEAQRWQQTATEVKSNLTVLAQQKATPVVPPADRRILLKTSLLCNLPRDVEWPVGAFASPNAPFVISVLSDQRMGDHLRAFCETKTIQNRPVVVKNGDQIEQLDGCHILFIGEAHGGQLASILAAVPATALRVGETDDFLWRGGDVALRSQGDKVKMEVNPDLEGRFKISEFLSRLTVGRKTETPR
jgi:hypothetical protein